MNWEGKSIESNLARRLFPELKVYSWLNFLERSDNRSLSIQYLVNSLQEPKCCDCVYISFFQLVDALRITR